MLTTGSDKTRPLAAHAFFYALAVGVVIFLPFILYDGGYFIYYGDFNVQQIPFYKLAHEAVRGGDLFWNWYTDLGVNFIGSYSFYLLFSPFFWLTLPFPTWMLPHLMAPLLVLKTACASLTAFLYLRRFVRDHRYAVIGSLLYAFSGWMSFNIFFNHFHEVAVFFPLLLLGLEKLVTEDKRGLFAAAVLVNALVNYWFFVGEVVFVVLYVLIRMTDKSWGMTPRKFLAVAVESVLGFALAGFAVVPSVMALMGNPRTGAEELLSGWNIWLYWHEQRQPAIVQSLFFPPELPARPNFLPDHGAKWASLSGWLPLFSMTGVLAYFFRRRNDWLKKLLAASFVFAMIPLLNSLFVLLNDSYYARWFYMPVLLMALATARALEDSGPEFGPEAAADFGRAIRWTGIVLAVFILMCGVTPQKDPDGRWLMGLAANPDLMWIYSAIAMVSLALVAALVMRFRQSPRFPALALAGVMAVSAGFGIFYLANGKLDRERSRWLIDHAVEGREKINLPEEPFARVDVYDSTDNIAMYWHRPTIQAFHSIVPPSIMEFYPQVGVKRDVASRPEAEFYALRPLLSVRWLFIEEGNSEQEPMPGYAYYDTQNDFVIYENQNYLRMGFSYDRYVTPRLMEDVAKSNRSNLMLRAVVLEEDAAGRLERLLTPLEDEGYLDFDADTMAVDVSERRETEAEAFAFDRKGFTVATNYDQPRLLFLSVPWEEGWSARLESESGSPPLRIERANLGFMAVQVPAGPAAVRFDYATPGLLWGFVVSGGAVLLLLVYLLLAGRGAKASEPPPPDINAQLLQGKTVTLTEEEFRAAYGDKESRQAHMQEVLNEMTATHIADRLPEEDQTLRFGLDLDPAPAPPPSDPPPTPTDADDPVGFGNIRNAGPAAPIIGRDATSLAAGEPLGGSIDPEAIDFPAEPPPFDPLGLNADPLSDDPLGLGPDPLLDDPLGLGPDPLLDDPLGLGPDPLLGDPLDLGPDPPPFDPLGLNADPLSDDPLGLGPDPLLDDPLGLGLDPLLENSSGYNLENDGNASGTDID